MYSWYTSLNITSRRQQPIGCKWRIDWFYVTYNQSTVGSSEDIVMVHIIWVIMGLRSVHPWNTKKILTFDSHQPSCSLTFVWKISNGDSKGQRKKGKRPVSWLGSSNRLLWSLHLYFEKKCLHQIFFLKLWKFRKSSRSFLICF